MYPEVFLYPEYRRVRWLEKDDGIPGRDSAAKCRSAQAGLDRGLHLAETRPSTVECRLKLSVYLSQDGAGQFVGMLSGTRGRCDRDKIAKLVCSQCSQNCSAAGRCTLQIWCFEDEKECARVWEIFSSKFSSHALSEFCASRN